MFSQKDIRIDDYDYALPEERIALYPLPERDASKLLVYRNGEISESVFRDIVDELPADALLVFNDTKVIHARMVTHTAAGARIEIFCLEPLEPMEVERAFQQRGRCVWRCFVGGNRKWKGEELRITNGEALDEVNYELRIGRGKQMGDAWEIIFEWEDTSTFAEVLEAVGKIPLPPYIHREAEESDEERYQTIFAKSKGSVAAPTASLHFSERVMKTLETKGIETATLTLHVGAGTFKPVTTETIGNHVMHNEKVIVPPDCLAKILRAKAEGRPIIAVGTTSLRSLESLFWLREGEGCVEQWAPYLDNYELQFNSSTVQQFNTSLMIVPGYHLRIATGIITNFHQPKSTLLLLIATMVGDDWRRIYNHALSRDFRFLSYGDACLLLP